MGCSAGLEFDVTGGETSILQKPAPRAIVPYCGNHGLAPYRNDPVARASYRRLQRLSRRCNRTTEEMQIFETAIGVIAAMLTSLSYVPQVRKVRAGQSTEDLSSRMLIALTSGLGLWVLYGAVKADWIIIAANVVGTSLTGYVLYHKLHERQRPGRASMKHG
jgi:MtN3 and saliva related transmembrane protein